MKFPRLALLLAALVLLSGCGYTHFRSANLRGQTIADWTARGFYYRVSGGYRITAIERRSGPPYPHESHYRYGRLTTVTGPVIEHWPTSRPEWLDDDEVRAETHIEEPLGPVK